MGPVALAGAQVAVGVVGGLIGNAAASGDAQAAREAADQAMRYLARIGMPPAEARDIVYQQYVKQGNYMPEFEQAVEDLHSRFEDLKADEQSKGIQLEAINKLRDMSRRGFTMQDEAALSKGQRDIATQENARRESILQNLQARGMGGSGAEIQSLLQSSQGGANKEADLALQLAALRGEQSSASVKGLMDAASSFRQQGFEEEAKKRAYEDEMNKFSKSNQINRQARNVAAENVGRQLNLSEQQRIADINAGLANQEIQRKAGAPIRDWERQAGWLQGMAKGSMDQSNYLQGQADRTANKYAGITNALTGGIGGIAGAMGKQTELDAYNARTQAMNQPMNQPAPEPKKEPQMLYAGSPIGSSLFRLIR